jgi:GINS complex subunit 4
MNDFGNQSRESRIYQLLEISWINEKSSPEILKFPGSLIDKALVWLRKVNEMLETDEIEKFLQPFYEIEAERVRYLLRTYLEIRLEKIEIMAHFLVAKIQLDEILSSNEIEYLHGFIKISDEYFISSVISKLPRSLQKLNDSQTRIIDEGFQLTPNLDENVFCRILEPLGNVEVDPKTGLYINLIPDDIYRMCYRVIRPFIESGSAILI